MKKNYLFLLFLFIHVIGWTLLPALIRYNLPLDAMEGTTWGHQLEWGYDKNPFLNAWLTNLATHLGGSGMVYFFSQLSVAACFIAVYQLGKKMLSPVYALVAVMLLEGLQYFNFHAIDFDDNVLELGLWGLTIYFFYRALCIQRTRAWILTGFFAALGVMAKYYTFALIGSLAIFFLIDRGARAQLKTRTPYWGLLTFLILITPHTLWLFHHQFITVTYVFQRTHATPNWLNHIYFPAQFAWQQLEVFLPALIIYLLLWIRSSKSLEPVSSFNKKFIFIAAFMPLLLTLLLSLLTGARLRAGWGMPLLSFWPLALLVFAKPTLTKTKLVSFITGIYLLLITLLTGYYFSIVDSTTESTANFPGKEIAHTLTMKWRDAFHTQLKFVAGSRWLGGNIAFYSPEHPAVFMEWNKARSPWIHDAALIKNGAIFIWDINAKETLPPEVKAQFPQLQPEFMMEFSYLRNKHHIPPIKIGVAFLPPELDVIPKKI